MDLDSDFSKSPLLPTSPSPCLFLNHSPSRKYSKNDTESDGSGTAFEFNPPKSFNKSPIVRGSDIYESDQESGNKNSKNTPQIYYKTHPLRYIYHLSTSLPETRTNGFSELVGKEIRMEDGYQSDGDVVKLFSPSMASELGIFYFKFV